jgi:hypothetical protein
MKSNLQILPQALPLRRHTVATASISKEHAEQTAVGF